MNGSVDLVFLSITIDLGTSGIKLMAPLKKASAVRVRCKGTVRLFPVDKMAFSSSKLFALFCCNFLGGDGKDIEPNK